MNGWRITVCVTGHVYDRVHTLPVDYALLMEEEETDGYLSGVESGQTR